MFEEKKKKKIFNSKQGVLNLINFLNLVLIWWLDTLESGWIPALFTVVYCIRIRTRRGISHLDKTNLVSTAHPSPKILDSSICKQNKDI